MGLFSERLIESISQGILPDAAKQALLKGQMPTLLTDTVLLKKGEKCIYIEKAVLTVFQKDKINFHAGSSSPGIFSKNTRFGFGSSWALEGTKPVQYKGILYITTQRTIFKGEKQTWSTQDYKGFDKSHKSISTIETYTNAVILQYGSSIYYLVVPNGTITDRALRLAIYGK